MVFRVYQRKVFGNYIYNFQGYSKFERPANLGLEKNYFEGLKISICQSFWR